MSTTPGFHEAHSWRRPIRDLGLTLEGTPLEPLVAQVREELVQAGLGRVRPRFYLSTEWGVPDGTVAVAIPFYLVDDELTQLHERHAGHVEGKRPDEILRYLRHELGHVLGYAYVLHEDSGWQALFGSMDAPYRDDYRPSPFSRRHVHHLPGWYAQKHPDEDWAETFAVWMTPGRDWRAEYAEWPEALAKLEWCDAAMAGLRDREPIVTDDSLDEDVAEVGTSLGDFFGGHEVEEPAPSGIDGALRTVFESLPLGRGAPVPAADLVDRLRPVLPAEVYRWTGHFPERTASLLGHLAARARAMELSYPADVEVRAIVGLTALVTALAMNWIARGAYSP